MQEKDPGKRPDNRLPDIRHVVVMKAPIHKVWQAVSTSEGLAAWLMPCNFQAELGYEFTFRSKPKGDWDGIVHCKVIELNPPHRLAFTWGKDQQVSFELMETEGQTELILVHSGWSEGQEVLRGIMEDGWGYLTRGLRDKMGEE